MYTMQELTSRQASVLDFLRKHIAAGTPPALREIADAFDIRVNGAVRHLKALEKKGYIELLPGQARGIRLVGETGTTVADALALPLVGRVAAGAPILSEAHIEREVTVDRWLFRPRPDYLLRVQGDSMRDDGILDGDLIGVHRTPSAEHGQTVIARVGDDGFTVKRLYHRAGQVRLLPRNDEFEPIDPDPTEDFAVEGLFCGLVRPGMS